MLNTLEGETYIYLSSDAYSTNDGDDVFIPLIEVLNSDGKFTAPISPWTEGRHAHS